MRICYDKAVRRKGYEGVIIPKDKFNGFVKK